MLSAVEDKTEIQRHLKESLSSDGEKASKGVGAIQYFAESAAYT